MRVAQVGHQVEHLRLHRDVERAHRLVGDDQLGPRDQRAGDGDALSLAAGEFVRVLVERVGAQAHGFEHGGGALALLDAAGAFQRGGRLGHGAPDAPARVERAVGVLEHHLEVAPRRAQIARRQRVQVTPLQQHLTGRGRLQRHHQPRQRALARTRFTHDAQAAPGHHPQRHALERMHLGRRPEQ